MVIGPRPSRTLTGWRRDRGKSRPMAGSVSAEAGIDNGQPAPRGSCQRATGDNTGAGLRRGVTAASRSRYGHPRAEGSLALSSLLRASGRCTPAHPAAGASATAIPSRRRIIGGAPPICRPCGLGARPDEPGRPMPATRHSSTPQGCIATRYLRVWLPPNPGAAPLCTRAPETTVSPS
ncbi:hypothetical protein BC834DRAFT_863336 [Gloeopeniophorella convolvens]|nr:hypothetical protein BC834DRAFT_863336 [Gloeopeniophorella convolvens]